MNGALYVVTKSTVLLATVSSILRSRKASLLIRTRCTGPSHHLLQIQSIFSLNDKLLSNLKILKTT